MMQHHSDAWMCCWLWLLTPVTLVAAQQASSSLPVTWQSAECSEQHERCNIRMAWLRIDPWHYKCSYASALASSRHCLYPGSEAELVRLVTDAAGLSIQLVKTNHSRIKQIGSIPARIEMIVDGVVDTDTQIYWYTDQRQKLYEMSTVVLPTYLAAIASNRISNQNSFWKKAFSFTEVYNPEMWLLIFVVLGASRAYVAVLLHSRHRHLHTTKLTTAVLAFFIGMIVALYKSGLLARLVVNRHTFAFTDFDSMIDALNDGRIHMIANKGQGWLQIIKKAASEGSPRQVKFEEAMARHPPRYIEDLGIESIGEYIENTDGVYISEELQMRFLSSQYCNTRIVPLTELGYYNAGLLFAKNVSQQLLARINTAINKLQSAFDTIQNRYRHMLERKTSKTTCEQDYSREALQPLALSTLLGAFLVLLGSCVLAGALLTAEATWHCHAVRHGQPTAAATARGTGIDTHALR